MPSTSKKQHNFMAAVANNPAFAKKAGVPQSVGKDFLNADKGKTFKRGGEMATKMNSGMMAMMAKKKDMAAGKKSVMPSKMGKPVMKKGMDMAKDGMKMASGGMPMVMKDGQKVPAFAADGKGKMAHGGTVKKMASGGLAAGHKAADGVASKGKTKGKMIAMKSGGSSKKYC
jgi:hypothetical protein